MTASSAKRTNPPSNAQDKKYLPLQGDILVYTINLHEYKASHSRNRQNPKYHPEDTPHGPKEFPHATIIP